MNLSGKPALAGGEPVFETPIPFVRPIIEDPKPIIDDIGASLASGMLTDGPLVERLEERMSRLLQVDHCVAVSSCTTGLILLFQALGKKTVTIPSFTFSATAHAARWNQMDITFADCDPESWLLGPEHVVGNPDVIVGVHISGVPCDVKALEAKATELGATLVFDAAHGAGSSIEIDGAWGPVGGYGTAEVFSLTPTKVLSGPEGGIVATNDPDLAATIRRARNYGNPGSYDTLEAGMNGRMSELHAAVILAGIDHLENRVKHRNALAENYRSGLGSLPGIGFQEVPDGRVSSVKDFTITVGPDFEVPRDRVVAALTAEGIPTRPYYSPPLHRQTAYADLATPTLPVTETLASQVISLPVWSDMDEETAGKVIAAMERIHRHRSEL